MLRPIKTPQEHRAALARIDQVRGFLRQGIYDESRFEDAQRAVLALG